MLTLFLVSLTAIAQEYGIRGKITNKEGTPLGNVNIINKETSHGCSTDDKGLFFLLLPSKGDHTILISALGYNDEIVKLNIELEDTLIVNIVLKEVTVLIDEVKIYEDDIGSDKTKAAYIEPMSLSSTITVINESDIKNQSAKSLIEAMKYVPGSLTETRGRKVKQFYSVRGQTYPYPEFAINGVWQREFGETSYIL